MFKSSEDLRATILTMDLGAFVSHHIFEPTPFAFSGDQATWIDYKSQLASLLQVDAHEIILVGSAAVGFSLNPEKKFAKFGNKSDFDIAVVSGYHFDEAWRYLRQLRVGWLDLPSVSRDAIRQHRKSYVFTGTIAANWFLQVLPFGMTWQAALNRMSEVEPSRGRDIKLRIYKDYDCLRFYHTNNLRRLRENMLEDYVDTNEMPIANDYTSEEL